MPEQGDRSVHGGDKSAAIASRTTAPIGEMSAQFCSISGDEIFGFLRGALLGVSNKLRQEDPNQSRRQLNYAIFNEQLTSVSHSVEDYLGTHDSGDVAHDSAQIIGDILSGLARCTPDELSIRYPELTEIPGKFCEKYGKYFYYVPTSSSVGGPVSESFMSGYRAEVTDDRKDKGKSKAAPVHFAPASRLTVPAGNTTPISGSSSSRSRISVGTYSPKDFERMFDPGLPKEDAAEGQAEGLKVSRYTEPPNIDIKEEDIAVDEENYPERSASLDGSVDVDSLRRRLSSGEAEDRSGAKTVISPHLDSETARALKRENESASILAHGGLRVEQNPRTSGRKNPDFKISGVIFDNIAPVTNKVGSIWSRVYHKVESGQTRNIVINLADSPVSPDEILKYFGKNRIDRLKTMIIIDNMQNITIHKHGGA